MDVMNIARDSKKLSFQNFIGDDHLQNHHQQMRDQFNKDKVTLLASTLPLGLSTLPLLKR